MPETAAAPRAHARRAGFRAAAPAKINLYLHVVGRRPDGYHLLDSLIAFADVHDTVVALPGEALTLTVEGPFAAALGGGPDNLVLGAARALADWAGIAPRARLRLVKRLPVASGIGGGSSDAAAALRALSALWNLRPGGAELQRIALALGADVPACLAGRAAFMGGIGEQLAPAPALPPAAIVLVNPGTALATAPVFKARTVPFSAPARFAEAPRDARALAAVLQARRNDLTEAALGLAPAIGQVLEAIAGTPGVLLARMSGSGATCFGLYPDAKSAETAAASIRARGAAWWVAPGRLVGDIGTIEAAA